MGSGAAGGISMFKYKKRVLKNECILNTKLGLPHIQYIENYEYTSMGEEKGNNFEAKYNALDKKKFVI